MYELGLMNEEDGSTVRYGEEGPYLRKCGWKSERREGKKLRGRESDVREGCRESWEAESPDWSCPAEQDRSNRT